MKRVTTTTRLLSQARRYAAPDASAAPDLGVWPQLDWPIDPALQRAVASTVSEALALRLPVIEATTRVAHALRGFGVQLNDADLDAMVHSTALGAI